MRNFKVRDLKLAELKYYDEEHNGIEVMEPLSYVVLLRMGNSYVNFFKPEEIYPVFERTPYANVSVKDGEEFGTKVRLLTDEEDCVSGPCWLLDREDDSCDKRDVVSVLEVEDYVLNSYRYFKDRIAIANERLKNFEHPFLMWRIIKRDGDKALEIEKFFEDRKKSSVKVKCK